MPVNANFIILQNDQIIYSLTCELGYKLIRMNFKISRILDGYGKSYC